MLLHPHITPWRGKLSPAPYHSDIFIDGASLPLYNIEIGMAAEAGGGSLASGPLARSLPLCGPLLYRKAIHPNIIYFVESEKGLSDLKMTWCLPLAAPSLLDLIIDGMSQSDTSPPSQSEW